MEIKNIRAYYHVFEKDPNARIAYNYGYNDAIDDLGKTLVHRTSFLEKLQQCLLVLATLVFVAYTIVGGCSKQKSSCKSSDIDVQYRALVENDQVSNGSIAPRSPDEQPAKEISWCSDGKFHLKNVEIGRVAFDDCFGGKTVAGVDPYDRSSEVEVEDGKELVLSPMENGGPFNEALKFTYRDKVYEVLVFTDSACKFLKGSHYGNSKIVGYVYELGQPHPKDRPRARAFWFHKSFWNLTTYANVILKKKASDGIGEKLVVGRSKDNRIFVRFETFK